MRPLDKHIPKRIFITRQPGEREETEMSERKYFPINEGNARTAHNMMSMRDYSEGSTTAGYRREVDKAYDVADKVAEKKPEEAERAYRLAERYSKKMAEYYNKESSIGMMCPSVMISGAGNFPVKKKERQVAAWERNHEFYQYVQGILAKIENILYGREIIKSDDERAIEKLEEKLEDLKSTQEQMKAANKAIRLKDTEAGDDLLREMGYSEECIKKLREPDYCGRVGYPSFQLQNNNANIHRVEGRLKSLKAAKEMLEGMDGYTEEELYDALVKLAETLGVKNGQVLWPVRIGISGLSVTPGGATELIMLLGKEETLRRMEKSIQKLENELEKA